MTAVTSSTDAQLQISAETGPSHWLVGLGTFARRWPLGAAGAVIILLMIG